MPKISKSLAEETKLNLNLSLELSKAWTEIAKMEETEKKDRFDPKRHRALIKTLEKVCSFHPLYEGASRLEFQALDEEVNFLHLKIKKADTNFSEILDYHRLKLVHIVKLYYNLWQTREIDNLVEAIIIAVKDSLKELPQMTKDEIFAKVETTATEIAELEEYTPSITAEACRQIEQDLF